MVAAFFSNTGIISKYIAEWLPTPYHPADPVHFLWAHAIVRISAGPGCLPSLPTSFRRGEADHHVAYRKQPHSVCVYKDSWIMDRVKVTPSECDEAYHYLKSLSEFSLSELSLR